jgi:hypothetical protein
MSRFVPGTIYDRSQLHSDAKRIGASGRRYSGITVVVDELCVFWNPYRKLYANRWLEQPSEFWYSGEGSVGPMRRDKGNGLLLDAESSGSPVQVFYKTAAAGSSWRALGPYRVVESTEGVSRDDAGSIRADLRFRFLADAEISLPSLPTPPGPPPPAIASEAELWDAQSLEVAQRGARRRRAPKNQRAKRQSSGLKTEYVRRRAIDFGGTCESCGVAPGWVRADGQPHFQAHHIVADIDLVDWIAAVCGTCHDRLHHGVDRDERAEAAHRLVVSRQRSLGRPVYSEEEARALLPASPGTKSVR